VRTLLIICVGMVLSSLDAVTESGCRRDQKAAAMSPKLSREARDLLDMLRAPSPDPIAAGELARLARAGEAVIPSMAEIALKHGNALARAFIVAAMADTGPAAKLAVPFLRQALKDHEPVVRGNAAAALAHIGTDAKEATGELRSLLDDKVTHVRFYAAYALIKLDAAQHGRAFPVILDSIKNKNEPHELREQFILVLATLGTLAKEAMPILETITEDREERKSTRSAASEALSIIRRSVRKRVESKKGDIRDIPEY
jgi:HEAT repeat protein